ncbi:MAG: Gx transporter family protein [Oscillospiraceae bacterium]|nr:Gx transporter family protein [Oscillospiraceae bacterium]
MAALTAIALIIFIVEAQIPLPAPVQGAKLGLANIVTLFALFLGRARKERLRSAVGEGDRKRSPAPHGSIGTKGKTSAHEERAPGSQMQDRTLAAGSVDLTAADALMILIGRIILGAVFTGRFTAFLYSLSGGLLAFAAQALFRRIVTVRQIWVCGVAGAIFHNVGQILAAMLVTGTPSIALLLPLLIAVSVITGVITGLVAQLAVTRLGAFAA